MRVEVEGWTCVVMRISVMMRRAKNLDEVVWGNEVVDTESCEK